MKQTITYFMLLCFSWVFISPLLQLEACKYVEEIRLESVFNTDDVCCKEKFIDVNTSTEETIRSADCCLKMQQLLAFETTHSSDKKSDINEHFFILPELYTTTILTHIAPAKALASNYFSPPLQLTTTNSQAYLQLWRI